MKFQKCYKVPKAKEIKEGYVVKDGYIIANVAEDSIWWLIEKFLLAIDEPCAMFIEVPCSEEKEAELRQCDSDPWHRDLYYMDCDIREELVSTWYRHDNLLLNSGCPFGFLSGDGDDRIEIGVYKFNVVYIHYSESMFDRIKHMLDHLDIPQVENLITAWENFSEKTPGRIKGRKVKGKTIFDLIEYYEKYGLYHHSVVDDKD